MPGIDRIAVNNSDSSIHRLTVQGWKKIPNTRLLTCYRVISTVKETTNWPEGNREWKVNQEQSSPEEVIFKLRTE